MILLTVFLAHDTFSELVVQETSDREGGRGGGGRVVARSAEDSGPRPTPFSACTLTLKQTSKGEKKMYRSVGVGDNSLSNHLDVDFCALDMYAHVHGSTHVQCIIHIGVLFADSN